MYDIQRAKKDEKFEGKTYSKRESGYYELSAEGILLQNVNIMY